MTSVLQAKIYNWLPQYWPICVLIFIGSGFVMPSLPVWAFVFYSIFIPFFLVRLVVRKVKTPPLGMLGVVFFLLWALLSFAWSPSWHGISDVICTAFFIGGGVVALQDSENFLLQLKRVCMAGMSCNAGIELFKLMLGYDKNGRPGGVGVFHTTLPAVMASGIFLLWACSLLLKEKDRYPEAWVSIFILPSFMLLSGSRMPCFIFGLAASLLLLRPPRYRLLLILGVACVGFAINFLMMWPRVIQLFQDAITRGDSYHYLIWKTVWQESCRAPIVGHGQGASVLVYAAQHVFAHAHNLYLGVLYSNGLIGVILLSFSFGYPILTELKFKNLENIVVSFFVLSVVMTDIATPLKGPSIIWYVLWIPWLSLWDRKNIKFLYIEEAEGNIL